MSGTENILIELRPYDEIAIDDEYNLYRIIYDLNSQIELLSSKADKLDYLVSAASGILCEDRFK